MGNVPNNRSTANFYKILPENILVFHDEVDLVLGKLRVKVGGRNAGHNGLKSIDEAIGKDYTRLRLGVGRPENPEFSTADYVLGKLGKEEMKTVKNVNKKVSNLIGNLLEGRADEFLNKFHLV